jgi:hypothetical protein
LELAAVTDTRFCTRCGHALIIDMRGEESWASRKKGEKLCGPCWWKVVDKPWMMKRAMAPQKWRTRA